MKTENLNYSNHLEFSKNEGKTKQKLLFDETQCVASLYSNCELIIPQSFYSDGFIVLDNMDSYNEAQRTLEKFIANIDTRKLPIYSRFLPRIKLAKVDRIPICQDLVKATFQALHYDMGQPIISDSTQTMYLIISLYCPKDVVFTKAKTRVARIKKLLSQKEWGGNKVLEKKLIDYVKNYGDGWTYPDAVNTMRISCFARIIDAVSGLNELTGDIDKTTGQWFQYEENINDETGIKNEYEFYKKCGIDLRKAEEQIKLEPGQLLIIDNLRTVHGRIGKRKPQELYQFMYGIKNATPEDIDIFREYLLSEFASNKD